MTFGLMPEGDPWDVWLRTSDDQLSYFQITLAYRATEAKNPGYEYALRLEHLNDVGQSQTFGNVRRNRETRKVEIDPACLEHESLVATYGDGIIAALKRKDDGTSSNGDLIVFLQDWLQAYKLKDFADAIARVRRAPIAMNFARIHILADEPGYYAMLEPRLDAA